MALAANSGSPYEQQEYSRSSIMMSDQEKFQRQALSPNVILSSSEATELGLTARLRRLLPELPSYSKLRSSFHQKQQQEKPRHRAATLGPEQCGTWHKPRIGLGSHYYGL